MQLRVGMKLYIESSNGQVLFLAQIMRIADKYICVRYLNTKARRDVYDIPRNKFIARVTTPKQWQATVKRKKDWSEQRVMGSYLWD